MTKVKNRKKKLTVITDYNKTMRGVDLIMLSSFQLARKGVKNITKIYCSSFRPSCFNAFHVYKKGGEKIII